MLTIDLVCRDQLRETSELHHKYLHMGLFPKMGKGFLRHYQDTFAESPYGIALYARNEEGVAGALFGTTSNASHYQWVLRNRGPELAAFGCLSLMMRPHVAYDFATSRLGRYARGARRYLFNKGGGTPSPDASNGGSTSVLSHIMTRDGQRRSGVGRKLVEEFRRLARVRGASEAMLVTEEGGQGTPFFERIGCECIGCRSGFDGRSVREYRLRLDRSLRNDEALPPLEHGSSLLHSPSPELVAARTFAASNPSYAGTLH
jgi:GNAT superfamily N-acetyltransferase